MVRDEHHVQRRSSLGEISLACDYRKTLGREGLNSTYEYRKLNDLDVTEGRLGYSDLASEYFGLNLLQIILDI